MKSFAITNPGLEKIAAEEIASLIDVKTKTEPSVVLFDCSEEQLAYVCYRAQTIIKAFSFLETFSMESVADIKKIKTDFSKVLPKDKTFRVKCARQGVVDFTAQEAEPVLADIICKQCNPPVSLKNPEYVVYLYVIDGTAYVGLDYCGFDLAKREYRVFAHPRSVHANIAASLLRLAEFEDGQTLVDAFCLSGEVAIEAALFASRKSPHYFSKDSFAFNKFIDVKLEKIDKEIKTPKSLIVASSPHMSDVRSAQKNAKIAAVEKFITFTRQDIEWLDFKFEQASVDCVVSFIPCPSANVPEKMMSKIYEDFFFNVKNVLAKGGRIVVCGPDLFYFKSLAKGLKLKDELTFMNGKTHLEVAVLRKA